MSFRYFDFGEERQFVFLQVPRILLKDERFQRLSGDAKLLYSLMLDRGYLSRQNGWYDEEGHPFIYFTAKAIQEELGVGRTKAFELLADLEACELIKRRRQGQCKPNQIYVGRFYEQESFADFMKYGKRTSGSTDNDLHEVRDTVSKENKIIQNNIREIHSIHPDDAMDERRSLADYFENQCNFDILKQDYKFQDEELDGIRNILIDTCASKAKTIRISGEEMPTDAVKSRFMKLNSEHIRYVMDCLKENTTGVTNIRAYLLTVLYHAPATIGHYYRQMVNYDMAHWNEKQE